MVTKFVDIHVLPKLASVTTISTSFELWMFKGVVDMFALVINYFTKTRGAYSWLGFQKKEKGLKDFCEVTFCK
jgi:hypothetical protein